LLKASSKLRLPINYDTQMMRLLDIRWSLFKVALLS